MTDMPKLVQVKRSEGQLCEGRVVLWPKCSGGPEG